MTRSIKSTLSATVVVSMLGLGVFAGCGGNTSDLGDQDSHENSSSTRAEGAQTAHPDGTAGVDSGDDPLSKEEATSAQEPANDTPLRVGETSTTSAGATRLIAVKNPVAGEMYDTPSPGMKFVSIHLKQCVTDANMASYVSEWFLLDANGGEYSSTRTMHGWPTPEFPQGIELPPGACKTGWMALEIKKGVKFKTIVMRDVIGNVLGKWTLPSNAQ